MDLGNYNGNNADVPMRKNRSGYSRVYNIIAEGEKEEVEKAGIKTLIMSGKCVVDWKDAGKYKEWREKVGK